MPATSNLLPIEEQRKRKVDLLNYYTLLGGIVVVIGTLILSATLLLFDQVYKVNLDSLQNQKKQAEGQAALYLDVQKKADSLQQTLASVQKAQSQVTHWSTLLTELQNITPANVSVQNIQLSHGSSSSSASGGALAKTVLTGHAESRRSVAEFQIALAASPYFKNPEIQTTTTSGTGVDYTINTDINYDKLNGPGK